MTLSARLATGELGLTARAPAGLLTDDDAGLTFADGAGRRWWWLWKEGLTLNLGAAHWPAFEGLLHRFSRAMFDDLFDEQQAAGALPAGATRRTEDAQWSPLIEAARVTLGGRPALWFTHRMLYVRGRELILSHVLAPTPRGTFEARWLTSNGDEATGLRESLVLATSGVTGFLPQAAYDDERLDAQLPAHPLSRAREGRRWLDSVVQQVSAPRPAPARHVVRGLGSLTLPAGFGPMHEAGIFARTCCCLSDGLEWLLVERLNARFTLFARRRAAAAAKAHFLRRLQTEGFEASPRALTHRGLDCFVAEAGGASRQRPRSVMAWRYAPREGLFTVTLHASAVRAEGELLDDATGALASLEPASG